jgi:3'-5' exoribonuclease
MPRPPKSLLPADPVVARLAELAPGQMADCFALLCQKDKANTRDGKPYYRVAFRDARRTATLMVWKDSPWFADCEGEWTVGEVYKLRVTFQESQYGPQIELDRWRTVKDDDKQDGFDPWDFAEKTPFDVDELWSKLLGLVESHIDDPALRTLATLLIETHADRIRTHSAAARAHHAYSGGWLEHVVSMATTCAFLADRYRAAFPELSPPLSKSLVVTGALCHDIGKLVELDTRVSGTEYTAPGRLIGHILLGRDLVREAAQQVPDLDPETLLRLEHIIVSHHDLPEFGSPIPPSTPEALIVHAADNLDAKFQMMAKALANTDPSNEFSNTDNPLKRKIFRGLAK